MRDLAARVWWAYIDVWKRPLIGPIIGALTPDQLKRAMCAAGRHREVRVVYGDQEAMIDEEIAPLSRELWRHGILTHSSCQNVRGNVMVEFIDVDNALPFLELVAPRDNHVESIYNRIVGDDEPDDWQRFRSQRMWQLKAGHPYDLNAGHPDEGVVFAASILVFFPRYDLPAVTHALQQEPE